MWSPNRPGRGRFSRSASAVNRAVERDRSTRRESRQPANENEASARAMVSMQMRPGAPSRAQARTRLRAMSSAGAGEGPTPRHPCSLSAGAAPQQCSRTREAAGRILAYRTHEELDLARTVLATDQAGVAGRDRGRFRHPRSIRRAHRTTAIRRSLPSRPFRSRPTERAAERRRPASRRPRPESAAP